MSLTDEEAEDVFEFLISHGFVVQSGPDEWATTNRARSVFAALATALLTDAGATEATVGRFFVASLDPGFNRLTQKAGTP